MIEKSFDKAYPIKINGIPQSTLTRAANRLLTEYAAAFGGWGSYARSVAFTLVDDGICHKCGGSGKQLPRLTDKRVAEIAKFFTERRQSK